MFSSDEENLSQRNCKHDGEEISKIVYKDKFGTKASEVVKAVEPLVKVLQMGINRS